jgi:hypothetical protein
MPVRSLLAAGALLALSLAACGAASSAGPVRTTPEQMTDLCAGVAESERERPSILERDSVESVHALMGEQKYLKYSVSQLRGAEIVVRAAPGLTRQWVARVLRCHVAWHDVVASGSGAGSADPLVVGRPDLSFAETETGFVVRIAGRSTAEGEEILRRAQEMASAPSAARN